MTNMNNIADTVAVVDSLTSSSTDGEFTSPPLVAGVDAIELELAVPLSLMRGDILEALKAAHGWNYDGNVPGDELEGAGPEVLERGWRLLKQISLAWHSDACPRFVLSASIASLLVSTKAPAVSGDALMSPYDTMLVEIPGEWTSMHGAGPLYVLLAQATVSGKKSVIIAASRRTTDLTSVRMPDVITRVVVGGESLHEDGSLGKFSEIMKRGTSQHMAEAVRYLVNTCFLVTAHSECAQRRSGKNTHIGSVIHDVRPPSDITVTAEFRKYAQQLVANRRIHEKKQALLHIVRGHWKRQATGPGRTERDMIWIKPYQRGVDSLGRVIERQVTITDRSIQ